MNNRDKIINKIFDAQNENGFWKVLSETDKYYPDYLHYVPNYRASLWTLILLADLGLDRNDERAIKPLQGIKEHLFDAEVGIYTLKEDHFPIPCLNGNMIYLDCYFNGKPDERSLKALEFFYKYQRFDDGTYVQPKNTYCSNTSCYGAHTCYWGVIKLLKGISFIPESSRTTEVNELRDKCVDFILLHHVCYSSHQPDKIMINKMDLLTFPNMYKSDFLEILWLLKREGIKSDKLNPSLNLLKSKQNAAGDWNLEREMHNMITLIGNVGETNPFITKRAHDVLEFYEKTYT